MEDDISRECNDETSFKLREQYEHVIQPISEPRCHSISLLCLQKRKHFPKTPIATMTPPIISIMMIVTVLCFSF